MTSDKQSQLVQQVKQLSQLLKDYGIAGKVSTPSNKEQKKIENLFPD